MNEYAIEFLKSYRLMNKGIDAILAEYTSQTPSRTEDDKLLEKKAEDYFSRMSLPKALGIGFVPVLRPAAFLKAFRCCMRN